MLTLRYIKRSSLLESTYGENRPGHIDHDRSAIEGPAMQKSCHDGNNGDNTGDEKREKQHISFSIKLIEDPDTGELRMGVR